MFTYTVSTSLRIAIVDRVTSRLVDPWIVRELRGVNAANGAVRVRNMVVRRGRPLSLLNYPEGEYELRVEAGGKRVDRQFGVVEGSSRTVHVRL